MEALANIYKLTNLKNGRIYIGQTSLALEDRIRDHLKRMRDEDDQRLLYIDMREIGIENFSTEVIDQCFERHKFIVEEHWYSHYFDKGFPMYDIKKGAKHSKNTRQRLSQARQTNDFDYSSESFKSKMSEKTSGEKNGMFGKKGEGAVNGRMVIAYDENGETIHSFVSVRTALDFLKVKGHISLNKACRTGERYKGYYWKKEWIDR